MNLYNVEADKADSIIVILEGSVKTTRTNGDGDEATMRLLQPGDTCSEAVMFMNGTSPINVETLSPTKILKIPERIVRKQVLSDAQFNLNLLEIVSRHYKNSMHQIDAMAIKPPVQRIGYYFLLKYIERKQHRLDLNLPFKKQALANYLGMTPETFSRALKKMQSMGISVKDDTINLENIFSLCHFCDHEAAAQCINPNKEKNVTCPAMTG